MRISPSAPPETVDELHAAFANEYCRTVAAHFVGEPRTAATLDDLATVLAAEHDVGETEAAVALHHTALPRLDHADVVDYDAQERTVEYRGHAALVVEDAEDTGHASNTQ